MGGWIVLGMEDRGAADRITRRGASPAWRSGAHGRALFMSAVFVLLLNVSVSGQRQMYEPARGSKERGVLMDAIREYDTKRDPRLSAERFIVLALRVQGQWAFAQVEQQLPNGVRSYGVAHVFLRKAGGRWRVAFSTFNDEEKVGVDGLELLRKRHRDFPKQLANFAGGRMAG